MQNLYIILGSVALSFAVYFLVFNKNRNASVQKQNPYFDLRRQAIEIKPEQLQLKLPATEEIAYGVIVDIGTNDGSVTVVAFSTGDASMYFSTGGGMIGGGVSHQNVKLAAIKLATVAQKYFTNMPKSYDLHVPQNGRIKFYILTNKGIHSFEDKESVIINTGSAWANLFYTANDVITQLRIASKK